MSKNDLFEPFIYIRYKRTFYQDRLGTIIGKTPKKDRFSSGDVTHALLQTEQMEDTIIIFTSDK